MTGEEVFKQVTDLFESHFIPGLHKLALIEDLLPDNKDQAPEIVQSVWKSLESSGEKGLREVLGDVLDEVHMFCAMMDLLGARINGRLPNQAEKKVEASKTDTTSDTPEASDE